MGLLSSLLPMLASAIPGVGPFAGPALAGGINAAQGGGILNSLVGAGTQIGLNQLPGMMGGGGGQTQGMASGMTAQMGGNISGMAEDIFTQMAKRNLEKLRGSFSGGMMGGL